MIKGAACLQNEQLSILCCYDSILHCYSGYNITLLNYLIALYMSIPPCLKCASEYVYQDQNNLVCPECNFEWNPVELAAENAAPEVKDANGTLLSEGDKVNVAKDLKVKGSSLVIKIGTKAVIKRIVDGKDHQLDCKIDGAGEMMVTAKFVKKA